MLGNHPAQQELGAPLGVPQPGQGGHLAGRQPVLSCRKRVLAEREPVTAAWVGRELWREHLRENGPAAESTAARQTRIRRRRPNRWRPSMQRPVPRRLSTAEFLESAAAGLRVAHTAGWMARGPGCSFALTNPRNPDRRVTRAVPDLDMLAGCIRGASTPSSHSPTSANRRSGNWQLPHCEQI